MSLVDQLEYMFNPKSVAVIGASNTFGKWGFDMTNAVMATTADRDVYPVNKKAPEICGLKAYESVKDVPDIVDFAVITVPPEQVPTVMNECVNKGVKAAIVTSGGLGETSADGARIEAEVVRIAKEGGLRFIGPNSMGHFNRSTDFYTCSWVPAVQKGNIGFISQSGNCGVHVTRCAADIGLGFSMFISSGNEADLHFEDYLEYLGQDDNTKVIIAYLEGLREGSRFVKLAKEITKKKPIVILKAGGTPAGTNAARSHTAALAGSDEVYNAMFRQCGVIRVNEMDELIDVAGALLHQPLPKSKRVGILSSGGGLGVLATDACARQGLELVPLSEATMQKLNDILPSRWSHGNPIDTVAAFITTFPCLWALLDDENVDAILMSGGASPSAIMPRLEGVSSSTKEEIAQALSARESEELSNWELTFEHMDRLQKPIILLQPVTENFRNSQTFKMLQEKGFLFYPNPERAAKALAHLMEYSEHVGVCRDGQSG